MDFTLALAHFCELHGPTSLICTQALPVECTTCFTATESTPTSPSPTPAADTPATSYFLSPKRPNSAGFGAFSSGVSDGDRCASCRMSLPANAHITPGDRPPLRTKEDVHVCGIPRAGSDKDDGTFAPGSLSTSTHSDDDCHTHRLVYLSSASPVDASAFATLRRATVRTLSGEQLPRGQTSGPLWFGDATTGYTIAYVFRLGDAHARGRQRYYALLALAGPDTTRAFAACPLVWDLFEQLATRIVRSAEAVAAAELHSGSLPDDSPPPHGTITPVSSFLTGRTTDPDGFPRRGMATVRATGIADLVDNPSFFCELHMIFVSMLQELGRMLGGMRVRPAVAAPETAARTVVRSEPAEVPPRDESHTPKGTKFTMPRPTFELANGDGPGHGQYPPSPLYSPGLVDTRQQVVV